MVLAADDASEVLVIKVVVGMLGVELGPLLLVGSGKLVVVHEHLRMAL